MSRKLNPNVFLRAAKFLEKELKQNKLGTGSCCCDTMMSMLKYDSHWSLILTPEYKLFHKLYGKNKCDWKFWFGSVCDNHNRPHHTNQTKRIEAMLKCHKEALKLVAKKSKAKKKGKK